MNNTKTLNSHEKSPENLTPYKGTLTLKNPEGKKLNLTIDTLIDKEGVVKNINSDIDFEDAKNYTQNEMESLLSELRNYIQFEYSGNDYEEQVGHIGYGQEYKLNPHLKIEKHLFNNAIEKGRVTLVKEGDDTLTIAFRQTMEDEFYKERESKASVSSQKKDSLLSKFTTLIQKALQKKKQ